MSSTLFFELIYVRIMRLTNSDHYTLQQEISLLPDNRPCRPEMTAVAWGSKNDWL